MGSIKGQYQLQRGLFMPTDLPELMGIDAALEGIARLNDPQKHKSPEMTFVVLDY